jgi:hypothetical protein
MIALRTGMNTTHRMIRTAGATSRYGHIDFFLTMDDILLTTVLYGAAYEMQPHGYYQIISELLIQLVL